MLNPTALPRTTPDDQAVPLTRALDLHAALGRWAFAAHPLDHFDGWEGRNYAVLHQLRMHAIGDRHELMTAQDIRQVGEPLAAVVWELP